MAQSAVLDTLLVLILLLLIPLGFRRGGLREVCSAAGLLLGLLIANEWAARWGTWIAERTGIWEDGSQFVVAVALMTAVTIVVGYGAGAAFSYRPGPGGRMYGALIALLIGAVFLGAIINFVARFLSDGSYPAVVQDGYLARALSIGLDWVLLAVGLIVVLATLFGMIVRERDTDGYEIPTAHATPVDDQMTMAHRPAIVRESPPDKIEPVPSTQPPLREATAAVTVKEVRHWEDPAPAKASDLAAGWHRTWPGGTKGSSLRARSESSSNRRSVPDPQPPDQQTTGSHDARIIREWLADDQSDAFQGPQARPRDADE